MCTWAPAVKTCGVTWKANCVYVCLFFTFVKNFATDRALMCDHLRSCTSKVFQMWKDSINYFVGHASLQMGRAGVRRSRAGLGGRVAVGSLVHAQPCHSIVITIFGWSQNSHCSVYFGLLLHLSGLKGGRNPVHVCLKLNQRPSTGRDLHNLPSGFLMRSVAIKLPLVATI